MTWPVWVDVHRFKLACQAEKPSPCVCVVTCRWWFAGITRDVYLYARPSQHIRDIEVRAGADGKLEVQVATWLAAEAWGDIHTQTHVRLRPLLVSDGTAKDMACGGSAIKNEALQCKSLE